MKNKKLIYVLIPLVILIWGLVGYRIIKQVRPGNSVSYKKQVIASDTSSFLLLDTIHIVNDYPDPFLKKAKQKNALAINNHVDEKQPIIRRNESDYSKTRQENSTATKQIKWPIITYQGTITNLNQKTKTVLVTINDKERLMSQNNTIDDVKLLEISEDSITVEFEKEKRIITKK